ncbi:MAG: PIG-L family deacetylase [Acidobacteria bacterium]|nr:MAG: PIG-L family deacetylase [Acidobacteriota bacterium]
MTQELRLMCVLAHPDDESLGTGGVLAKYSREGVGTYVVTATRGERGRFDDIGTKPGLDVVGRTREAELRTAARELGVREVALLDYLDAELDRADPVEASEKIAAHIRRVRPQVVVTFDPFGAYGHPDHIAIAQFTAAAIARAADAHQVSKFYYFVNGERKWAAYQAAFKTLTSNVDGAVRVAIAWPDWSITAKVDARDVWQTVWRAVQCHTTQMSIYKNIGNLTEDDQKVIWGTGEFYRVFSLVNGGRKAETDLFEGLRESNK